MEPLFVKNDIIVTPIIWKMAVNKEAIWPPTKSPILPKVIMPMREEVQSDNL